MSKPDCPAVRFSGDDCGVKGDWTYRRAVLVKPPPRYTQEEWLYGQTLIHDAAESERQNAESLVAEAARIEDETREIAERARSDIDFRFRERIDEVEHWKEEMKLKFGVINNEIDAESIYRQRVENALATLCHILQVDSQVLSIRDCRCGIDLVHDEPQKETLHEMKVVEGVQSVLKRTLEFCTEQLRLLRKAAFQLNKDLSEKDTCCDIDKFAYGLNEHRPEVTMDCDEICITDASDSNERDWLDYTTRNKLTAEKVINASIALRCNIDSLLRQVCEDLQKQICTTNAAYEKRLRELVEAKAKLEFQHAEITVKVREMDGALCKLSKAFEEKKAAAALSETRIKVRNRRPPTELIKDAVQRRLILECQELNEAMAKINAKVIQAKNSLRNLQRNQLEIEDAINVKTNSINIDECQVMPLRRSINVQEY
jgi:hypothetical protein